MIKYIKKYMLHCIRKFIENEINESYSSQKDLEKIADSIIEFMTNRIINSGYKTSIQFGTNYVRKLKLKELKDFVNSDVFVKTIVLYSDIKDDIKGSYNTINHSISININKSDTPDIIYDIENKSDYNSLLWSLKSSIIKAKLVHELQHNYDDYRFGLNKIHNVNNINPNSLTKSQYLNLQYEIDARISDSISRLSFYMTDWNYLDDNNIDYEEDEEFNILPKYNVLKMSDFDEIKSNFIDNFRGYDVLSPKDKKKVLKTLGKFYEDEKKFVIKHNKKIMKGLK